MHVYLIGAPGDVGGACTESWHAVRLWRRFGARVTVVPTWKIEDRWADRLAAIGAAVLSFSPIDFRLPAGSLAVSFCNDPFLWLLRSGRLADCRTVWVPSMCDVRDAELRCLAAGRRPDRWVFQSDYQARSYAAGLQTHGYTDVLDPGRCRLIRGWLDVDEFPFAPRRRIADEPFVIGRISRADPRKFSADTWHIYGGIRDWGLGIGVEVRARILGWSLPVERKLGRAPAWAECLAPGAESSLDFLRSLHLLVHAGGEAVENWPRFALEAMAAGVPVATDDRGGVQEMMRDHQSGMLCASSDQFARVAQTLLAHESLRLEIARRAFDTCFWILNDPETIWRDWETLFRGLELERCVCS